MRKGGGKAKGASFERECCRMLSLWVSNGSQEDCFWRSAMSGGRSTVAHTKGKRLAAQAGDITCTHPLGAKFAENFLAECKNYASLDFDGLITGKGNLIKFWNILMSEALKYKKLPFLLAKQNRMPILVGLSPYGMDALFAPMTSQALLQSYRHGIILFEAETFFNVVKPSWLEI